MVVALALSARANTRAGLCLLLSEHGQNAEDDGDADVELDAHEALGDGVGNVLKVHGLALDEHANGNDCVKGPAGVAGGEGG